MSRMAHGGTGGPGGRRGGPPGGFGGRRGMQPSYACSQSEKEMEKQ